MAYNHNDQKSWATIYVFLQFLFLIALFVPWRGWPALHWPIALAACATLACACAVFLWTLRYNSAQNSGPSPIPPEEHQLITSGPYRYIRHPMYLAAVIAGFAAFLAYGEVWRLALLAGLCMVLHFKASYEEKLLVVRYPEYTEYQKRSKRIIPFVL